MGTGQLLIVLAVAAAIVVSAGALHRVGIPTPVVLVLAGLIIGFLPFVPDVSLPPHVVLLGLLPLLVFDAAVTSSPTAFRREAFSIGLLAVLLVILTAVAVAAVAHGLGHLPWPMAFILGTAVSPTDAAAATSIARRLGLPRRLVTILEGEALFNDATALVLYAAAVVAATSGEFSVGHTALAIAYSTVIGAAIGMTVGMGGRWLRGRIDDPPIEIAGSILLAYAAYLPAEALHASGVLAAVCAGLYLGWHSSGAAFSARSRLQSNAFWETLAFLVNGALFVLVGLSFHAFSHHAPGPVGDMTLVATAVVATVIVVRLASMWAFGWLVHPQQQLHAESNRPGLRVRLLLGWAGMRGAITLAAVLAVPRMTDGGAPLAGRDDTIYLGFAVILVTLVAQGMTLPALAKRLGLREHPTIADASLQARIALTHATLERLQAEHDSGELPQEVVQDLQAQYNAKLRALESVAEAEADNIADEASATAATQLSARRDLIAFQRHELSTLRQRGVIGTTSVRILERELDLEETRLSLQVS
jgi:Na+/H+ antiporter